MTSSGVFGRTCIRTRANIWKERSVLLGFMSVYLQVPKGEATTAAINMDRATEATAGPEPRGRELRRWGG